VSRAYTPGVAQGTYKYTLEGSHEGTGRCLEPAPRGRGSSFLKKLLGRAQYLPCIVPNVMYTLQQVRTGIPSNVPKNVPFRMSQKAALTPSIRQP
jgi:hypothetical protein